MDDPATGKKVPTCHRSSFDSILEDTDFDQACENADPIARRLYRDEAKAIEGIRKGILEVSGKEEPYDIFICYKETDENGSRTIDSVIAQDVYDALTEKGYRVFFSRISLEDKLGTEYEPYIFAALNSAKIMLVFGTDFEYFNAVWVKNEWSRFLKLITQDKSKHLIPCYKNVDAYDMPKEFAKLQAQDMGKVGAVQDLLRGIGKLLPKGEAVVKTVVVQQSAAPAVPGVESLLKRGNMALEDGDWDRADKFFEQALNIDAECGEAYLGKALAARKCDSFRALVDQWKNIVPEYKTLVACQEDTVRLEAIVQQYVVPSFLNEDTIRQTLQKIFMEDQFDFTYQSTADNWRTLLDKTESYFIHDKLMRRAVRYASSDLADQLEEGRKEIQTALGNLLTKAQQEDKESVQRVKLAYAAYLDRAEETVAKLNQEAQKAQKRRNVDYTTACAAQKKADTEEEFRGAAERFEALGSYQDSIDRAKLCWAEAERKRQEKRVEAERKRQEERADAERKRQKERAEAERRCQEEVHRQEIAALEREQQRLQNELANLSGLFTGKRRKEIESSLVWIEAELKQL